MKFKLIFIIFSVTLLFFIAFITILPMVLFNYTFIGSLLNVNWPFLLILFLLLAGFSLFYFTNKRLFFLLEKEDWPELAHYLEDKVIRQGKYSPRLIRLLANTYLVLSDAVAVMNLENKVAIAKPGIINTNALVFGTARILGGDISGAVRFFGTRVEAGKSGKREWIHWYYGFAMLLDRKYEESEKEFSVLARLSKDAIITGLSSYFLSDTLASLLPDNQKEIVEIASAGRERVRKALPTPKDWGKEISRFSAEIHVATIMKYLKEAGAWIYSQ